MFLTGVEAVELAPEIKDKVIAITGASSGLGAASALLLSRLGASLVLGARRSDRLDLIVSQIHPDRSIGLEVDVAQAADVNRMVQTARERFGRIDVMVNNAGVMSLAPLERCDAADWNAMIDTNIKGVLNGIAAALPVMISQKSGHIINIASVAGHKVRSGSAVYSATKHAVRVISEGLRQEATPHGIRTTIISPGAVTSELADKLRDPKIAARVAAMNHLALPAEAFARILAFTIGQPAEVDVNEVLFRPTAQEY